VVPVFKKDDRTSCSNCWPISLTCIPCKIFEHVIYCHIFKHLTAHNILTNDQHGFSKHHSCDSQLLSVIEDFSLHLNQCQLLFKSTCYTTYVCSILEYASTVWSPHLACNINKLKMVQCRSTRFVYNDFRRTSSVTTVLNDFHWPTLETRRHQAKLLMLYKILNNTSVRKNLNFKLE